MSVNSASGANYSPTDGAYSGLKPFKAWVQMVLPQVYNDALSYQELIYKMLAYLNTVIDDVTTTEENVTALHEAYDALETYVNDTFATTISEINDTLNAQDEYLENYDYQSLVDNKLDAMAEDGTLTTLITPLLPDAVSDWLSENISTSDGYVVDESLSVSGAAADAAIAGDYISNFMFLLNGSMPNDGFISLSYESTDNGDYYKFTFINTTTFYAQSKSHYLNINPGSGTNTTYNYYADNVASGTITKYQFGALVWNPNEKAMTVKNARSLSHDDYILAFCYLNYVYSPWNDFAFSANNLRSERLNHVSALIDNKIESAVDDTLSVSGAPADAAVAGDYISNFMFLLNGSMPNDGFISLSYESTDDGDYYKFTFINTTTFYAQSKSHYLNIHPGSGTNTTYNYYADNVASGTITKYQFGALVWNPNEKAMTVKNARSLSHDDYILAFCYLNYVYSPWNDFAFSANNLRSERLNHVSALIDNKIESAVSNISFIGYYKSAKIFRRVICIGDSFTSGHCNDWNTATAYPTNEEFSWVHHMALLTGNDYVNCGSSGATVLTWQKASRGLTKMQSEDTADAFLIGLGINDGSTGTSNYVEVGDTDDIGTDAQTYYGGLSQIIDEIFEHSPHAYVFVQNLPRTSSTYAEYNQAMSDVVDYYYENGYRVYLLDLHSYISLYQTSVITDDAKSGHYSGIGYQAFAENLLYIWSTYINNNISEFHNVTLIDYES